MPLGWKREQDNIKHVQKTDAGYPLSYISREYGVNRIEGAAGPASSDIAAKVVTMETTTVV